MTDSSLPFENEIELFGIGMGLFTVGAAWFLVGLHGPFTGALSTTVLTLSTPFLLAGLLAVTAPAFVTLPTLPSDSPQKHDGDNALSSSNAPLDD